MNSADEFISQLAEHLSLPDIYQDLRELLDRHEMSIKKYVDVIEQDSMLRLRILRIANSRYFGFPRKAPNLYQAISLIGIMQLHDLVLNSLSMRAFTNIPQQIFCFKSFWEYCVKCGVAARSVAQLNQILTHNHYFTLGLLHEIGHAAMYAKAPELSLRAMEESEKQHCPVTEMERQYFGFDYTEVGTALMQQWQLPEIYQQVTAHHLDPDKSRRPYRQSLQIIQLAHHLCQNQDSEQDQLLIQRFRKMGAGWENLPENTASIIYKDIKTHTDNILSMLYPSGTHEMPIVTGYEQQ